MRSFRSGCRFDYRFDRNIKRRMSSTAYDTPMRSESPSPGDSMATPVTCMVSCPRTGVERITSDILASIVWEVNVDSRKHAVCIERRSGECDPGLNPPTDLFAEMPRRNVSLGINATILPRNASAQWDWKLL